jgi:hypothetical protein
MANVYRIDLVDGETGRNVDQKPLDLFSDAFIDPDDDTRQSYEAEISDEAFEPEDVNSWAGERTWEIDNATHYQLIARIKDRKGTLEHIFEFTVEDNDDGSRGKYIEDGQVRWTSSYQKS